MSAVLENPRDVAVATKKLTRSSVPTTKVDASVDDAKRHELAFCANLQIQQLAMAVIARLEDSTEEVTAEVGMLARICQLSDIVHFSARLYYGSDESNDSPTLASLDRMFKGFIR
ncbi:hypothetical protein [Variovorax sp. DAIF25]|uniref:hypothetical protein n=1 Tax=Variovorax sp. DAIF25 TaxID=3080983 RepID=UPI003D6AE225